MEENKIVLLDDDGKENEFELVMSFDVEDRTYVLLATDEESEDVFPFVIQEDENGEEVLMPVENEEEFALIEETYAQLAEEEDDDCGCEGHHHDHE